MIYFDNAATTFPKPEEVYARMDVVNRTLAVNAGRGSYKKAQEASKLIDETKQALRNLVHADISASVVFSPSVTIAMNQIINGMHLRDNAVIYISPFDHNAVARTLHRLGKNKNITIHLLPVDEVAMEIDIEKTQYMFIKEKPDAVFCTHVSNVTGYVLPVKKIFELAKQYGAITVLDSAQSMGLIDIDVRNLEVDIIAFAGHKTLYGPFGIGGFLNITGIPLEVFITGGTGSDSLNLEMPNGAETRYEAASSNISAIAGLKAAIDCIDIESNRKKEEELTEYLLEGLSGIEGINILVPTDRSQHVGIISFFTSKMSSEDIGLILDEDFDIAVRTGYHCAPFIHKILKDEKTNGTVRIGLGIYNTKEEIDVLVDALQEVIG